MKNEITIPLKYPALNEIISIAKKNPKSYSNMKRKYTGLSSLYVKKLPLATKPISITFHWYGDRRRDPDNISVGAKFILDAMVKAKRIPDDSQKWIKGISHVFHYAKKHSVTLIIT